MAICVLFAFASFSIVAFSRVLWITLLGEINEAVGEIYTFARVQIPVPVSLGTGVTR